MTQESRRARPRQDEPQKYRQPNRSPKTSVTDRREIAPQTLRLPTWWDRRAQVFEAARPRPDDFVGAADDRELADLDRRCAELAAAYRRAADSERRRFWEATDAPS